MYNQENYITLQVEGMDCSNCALGIAKNLQKKGMQSVHVDFATGEASFYLTNRNNLKDAIKGITELGYAVVDKKFGDIDSKGFSQIEKRFLVTLPFTVLLFLSHILFSTDFILNNPIIQLVLCIPVMTIGVIQFGKSALGSIKAGVPNMDVLIFIGSTAAFIYSLSGIFFFHDLLTQHQYLFFETAATIITLVLLGNVFEHRSIRQTTSALRDLTAIQIKKAKIISLQMGREVIEEIEFKNISVGAILQVNEGDNIPVDGIVLTGVATIDESMITGESEPITKNINDKVIGGTILRSGNIRMRAEAVGNNTVLSKIIELVKKAQQNKPEIQKIGDRIASIFVPFVLIISLLTFFINYFWLVKMQDDALLQSIMRSIAVLVISCPCAMGLATPTAVMVGIGRAAKMGILIKGGSTLEAFAKVKTIVFDKTGTLTSGNFKISSINYFNDTEEADAKEIIVALETYSSHPLAKSIVAEFNDVNVQIKFVSVKEEKGVGVTGIDENGNVFKAGSQLIAKHLNLLTQHSVYVFKNDKLIATIDLEDELKDEIKRTIDYFKSLEINSIMLSGDTATKCQAVADKIGIQTVYSQQLPEQKLAIVEKLSNEEDTAMVGDGINDAPALAKATVSISMSNATEVAKQSAQIILLKSKNFGLLCDAHLISKHTLKTIKQNLFWAFFYNVVAIPIAAVGLLSPMVAALSMAFSDVIVIGNSIRLKTKKLI